MTRITISTYTHTCVVQDGPMAGNKHSQEVRAWGYEFGDACDFCGEPLITTKQLLTHIYRELTE